MSSQVPGSPLKRPSADASPGPQPTGSNPSESGAPAIDPGSSRAVELLRDVGIRLISLPRGVRLALPLLWAASLWWLSAQPGTRVVEDESFFEAWTYNTGHAFLYGILALLLVACLPLRGGWVSLNRGRCLWVLCLAMTYGVMDEIHQSWVPNRSASCLDLLTDLVGACATLAVITHLGQRNPPDPVRHSQRLHRLLILGLTLSWAAGFAATVLDP